MKETTPEQYATPNIYGHKQDKATEKADKTLLLDVFWLLTLIEEIPVVS